MNCNSGSSASQAGPSDDFPNSVPWRFSRTTLQVPQIIILAVKPFHVFPQILFAVFPQTIQVFALKPFHMSPEVILLLKL